MSVSATGARTQTVNKLQRFEKRISKTAHVVIRVGVILPLLFIGILKFSAAEAAGIQPLVQHSPFMNWMYSVWSVQGVSNVIGVVEIVAALLLASRPFAPAVGLAGSALATLTFVITLSFMATTPGVWTLYQGIPELSGAGQFLIKDIALLGGSLMTAVDSIASMNTRSNP
jgi:uncharacterized membrane protein YkgB